VTNHQIKYVSGFGLENEDHIGARTLCVKLIKSTKKDCCTTMVYGTC